MPAKYLPKKIRGRRIIPEPIASNKVWVVFDLSHEHMGVNCDILAVFDDHIVADQFYKNMKDKEDYYHKVFINEVELNKEYVPEISN